METTPELPIPISSICGRFFLFSIEAVSYLRREHHIGGVLIGSIPQAPSQNVFLGLPVELMPEEAQLLASKGIAFVIDDARAHDQALHHSKLAKREAYLAELKKQGELAADAQTKQKALQKQKVLKVQPQARASDSEDTAILVPDKSSESEEGPSTLAGSSEETSDSLFAPPSPASTVTAPTSSLSARIPFSVTPATSALLLPTPPPIPTPPLPTNAPASYPLFAHLQAQKYFLSPGLRFGCQYLVYPGDPLRFHSHFLAVSKGWDEAFDLMEIVGGGRLGTGVKKSFLIGGEEDISAATENVATTITHPQDQDEEEERKNGRSAEHNKGVRTWSIEWAAM